MTGIVHVGILEKFLMLILEEQCPNNMLFQQDGVPSHLHKEVMVFLNHKFLERYIHRGRSIT